MQVMYSAVYLEKFALTETAGYSASVWPQLTEINKSWLLHVTSS
jgi:hypothetical protein